MSSQIPIPITKLLEDEEFVTYKVMGKSMEPMIRHDHDLVTIRRKRVGEHFHENDVVLYRQKGILTLHRIVDCLPDGKYVLLGDNCSKKEYGISNEIIIGVVTSFKHNGLHYDIKDTRYLEYVQHLRLTERKRMRRKLLYDILVQHLGFLHPHLLTKIKSFLNKHLLLHSILI